MFGQSTLMVLGIGLPNMRIAGTTPEKIV